MYFFVIDRRSVTDDLYTYWDRLLPELQSCNILNEKREVESDLEATNLITKLIRQKRYQTIVAVGDDAFLASVAGAVKGSNIVLGYIPFGEHCAFGHAAGLSCQVDEVGSKLASRRFEQYDLVQIGRNFMVNSMHVGMFEYCDQKGLKPNSSYIKQFLGLKRYRAVFTARIETGDYSLELEASDLSVFNNYPFDVAPQKCRNIDPGDGVFNVYGLGKMSIFEKIKVLRDVCQTNIPSVTHLRVRQSRISIRGEVKYLVDGRYLQLGDTFDIQVQPGAFRLIR